jgi:hypothetical protein
MVPVIAIGFGEIRDNQPRVNRQSWGSWKWQEITR